MKSKIMVFSIILGIAALLIVAATFAPGYVGGRLADNEYYVDSTGIAISLPGNASFQYGSMINGSSIHASTGEVWFTMGDGAQAAPVVSTPTAGVPTAGSYLEIGQSRDFPAGIKAIKLKTDTGKIAYVRVSLIY